MKNNSQDWKQKLTPEQYHVMREKGTERAYSGKYWDNEKEGSYNCAACEQELFSSSSKYHAGCGWPSFWETVDQKHLLFIQDDRFDMKRTEVQCKTCGSHLGHIFPDPRTPSKLQYCINSVALHFKENDPVI